MLEAFGIICEQENFTGKDSVWKVIYVQNKQEGSQDTALRNTGRRQELQLFIDSNWFLFVIKALNHDQISPPMLKVTSLERRCEWDTKSKALLISNIQLMTIIENVGKK